MGGWEDGAVEGGVVVEGEEVVVDVASSISRKGEHGEGVVCCGEIGGRGGRFTTGGKPSDGLEANGLHVTAAFESIGFAVVSNVVADVGVAAEELDGRVPLLAADDFKESGVFWRAQGDMAGN